MTRDASNGWRAEYAAQGVAQPDAERCGDCGGPLRREGDCRTCRRCGASMCWGGPV